MKHRLVRVCHLHSGGFASVILLANRLWHVCTSISAGCFVATSSWHTMARGCIIICSTFDIKHFGSVMRLN
jgi:hypothetical protein